MPKEFHLARWTNVQPDAIFFRLQFRNVGEYLNKHVPGKNRDTFKKQIQKQMYPERFNAKLNTCGECGFFSVQLRQFLVHSFGHIWRFEIEDEEI